MASELRVNTLKDASGNNSIATSFVASGSAKAWINFTGVSTTASRDSFNISSITDAGTGNTHPIAMTSAMANDDYAGSYYQMGGSGTNRDSFNNDFVGGLGNKTTTQFGTVSYATSAVVDSGVNDVIIMGDLA
tara:strand:+ start:285 stop:683 length:399 start_codon:yes stop_codon:yes gene_type:complete